MDYTDIILANHPKLINIPIYVKDSIFFLSK